MGKENGMKFYYMGPYYTENVADLEALKAAGELKPISPYCPKDVLIKVAELGFPLGSCHVDDFEDAAFGGGIESIVIETDGMGDLRLTSLGQLIIPGFYKICEELDYQVIEAFLRAGYANQMDASAAIQKNRKDIIELFEKYDVPIRAKVVVDGSMYVDDNGVVEIPEGVVLIEPGAFTQRNIKKLILPSSLEVIASEAFRWRFGDELRLICLPKGMKYVAKAPFGFLQGCRITFFDEFDYRCVSNLQETGHWRGGTECVVFSAKTNEIKFMHYLNDNEMTYATLRDYCINAWSAGCEFDFSLDDKWYPKMKTRAKVVTALNRICWPLQLDERNAKKYRAMLVKNIEIAIDHLSNFDDIDRLSALIEIDAVNVDNALKLAALAKEKKAEKLARALAEFYENAPIDSVPKAKRSVTKKLTPAQAADKAFKLLGDGDSSGLGLLEPVAKKLTPLHKSRLLEAVSVGCDARAIQKYWKLVGEVEFTGNALALAIMAGKEDNARMLKKLGATLTYDDSVDLRNIGYLFKRLYYKNAGRTLVPGGLYATLMDDYYFLPLPATDAVPGAFEKVPFDQRCTLLASFAKDGLFDEEELASLVLAATGNNKLEIATELLQYADNPIRNGAVAFSADKGFNVYHRLVDMLISGCSPKVAKFVLKNEDGEAIKSFLKSSWSLTYLKQRNGFALTRLLLPYLGPWNKGWGSIPLAACREGDRGLLAAVYKADASLIKKTAAKCIDAAQEAGNTELVAWLLEQKAANESASE